MLTSILAALALTLQQPSVSAPMAEDESGRPVISVTVNGGETFAFVVDTAAQQHVVMPRLVDRLDLEPTDDQTEVVGASGAQAARFYDLGSLSTAAFAQNGVHALALPNASVTEAWGIIGMDAFADRRVTFDRQGKRFALTPSGPAAEGMTTLPATIHGTFAIVEIRLNGAPIKAVIDSGAARSIANDAAREAMGWPEDDARLVATRPIEGATTQRTFARKGRIDSLALGPAVFKDVPLTFSDLSVFDALGLAGQPAVILGSDILNRLPAWAIDYPRKEFHLRVPTV